MLSRDLELSLNMAFKDARNHRHEFMTVEHLLLALLDNEAAVDVLRSCGADLFALRDELTQYIDETTPLIPEDQEEREVQPTLGFQRVLQRAIFHVQSSGKDECTGANVLVAVYSENESQAVYFLKSQNINRIDMVDYISHGRRADDASEDEAEISQPGEGGEAAPRSPLEEFTQNLNEQARRDEIDPLVGRTSEIERVAQVLARRRKNNPLLVGESG